MSISFSPLRALPASTNVLRGWRWQTPTSLRCGQRGLFHMSSEMSHSNPEKVKTPVSSDPKHHDETNKPRSDLTDGAFASLKGTPGKRDASSFEDQNLARKEKNTNSQNAQEPDSNEGRVGESDVFEKSGRTPKPFKK